MGRRKGSTNKPKPGAAGAPGAAPAVTDHAADKAKSQITDDQLMGLTSHHVEKYKKALAAKKAADADFKNICKAAKGEGVSLSTIKTWIDLDSPEGQKRVKESVEEMARIARWRNADIGTQFKLFDEGDTNSFQSGKECGLRGDPAKPPAGFDINEWMRGWEAGQKLKMESFKTLQKTNDAEFEAAAPPTAPHQDEFLEGIQKRDDEDEELSEGVVESEESDAEADDEI